MSTGRVQMSLFWLVSRLAFGLYRRLPVFGSLRASVGLIRDERRFLVIRRSDGRGFSFPGGLAWPWETHDHTLAREIKEETGLRVNQFELAFRYPTSNDIPCHVLVFNVQANGEMRGSWEGMPEWVELPKLKNTITVSQSYIVERLSVASA
jgi:8-oxo-dGTP pyrophosphatase MutT (NUDIX family)